MTAVPGQRLTLPSGSVWASEVHRHPCGAVIVVWHHVGGPQDRAGILAATTRRQRTAPNPLGVAIVLSLALALIAFGLVLAFGDGHGWWAAGLIAAGLLLLGRVLDVRGRR